MIQYSPTEQALLELLTVASEPLDVHGLVGLFYRDRPKPWHAEIVIRSAVRSLTRKAVTNGERFRVEKSRRPGQRWHSFRIVRIRNDKSLKKLAK